MSYEVGQAWISITPSFSGVIEAISAEAAKWGESAGSTFGDTFKARVDAALKSLPDAKVGADTSEAQAKIAEIRTELESLSSAHVGIDISEAEAQTRIEALKIQLDELGAKNPSIRVEVNAAGAEIELAAVALEADVVDKGLVDVGNSSGGAAGGLSGLAGSAAASAGEMSPLIGGMVALGAALIPIGGLAAGALATLPALIAGATTGLGALFLGFSGIPGAIQAFSASQKAPVGSGSSAGTALSNASAERNAANSVQSAEEALANARINGAKNVTSAEQTAAAAQVAANNAIITAEDNLVKAERGVTDAQYNQAQAQEAVAAARVSANNAIIAAQNNLVQAERTVTQAQYSEAQAQDAVVTARQNAQRQLDDYTNQLADAGLAARQAALDVTTTKAALDAALIAPNTTSSQLDQAQLTYDQALQRVTDLQTQNQQLTQDSGNAQAAGVAGNAAVLAAEKQLADAKQATIDATVAQAAAVTNVTTVTLAGDQQILNAEHQLAQARQATIDAKAAEEAAVDNITTVTLAGNQQILQSEAAVVQAKRTTTQSISDAQRSLEQALASQADAFTRAAIPTGTGATALQTYERAMAGLTPAGREFVTFVTGTLFPVFEGLKAKVQEAFLPLIQTGLTDLLPFFRDLGPLIEAAATGIGGTFDELAKFMGSKTGLAEIMQVFKDGNGFMAAMGGNFVTMFEAFTGVGAQAGQVVKALSDGITNMTNDFAKWVSNGGFEKFLAWLKENGPALVSDIADLIKAVALLVIDLAPLGVAFDAVIGAVGKLVQMLSPVIKVFLDIGVVILGIFTPADNLGKAFSALGNDLGLTSARWKAAWSDIKSEAITAWAFLKTDLFDPIVNFFTKTIPSTFDTVVGLFTRLPDKIATATTGMWHGISDAFKDAINTVIGWWDSLKFTIPGFGIGPIHTPSHTFAVPQIPKFHDDGVVQGAPGIEQLAWLMPGEIVTPAQAAIPGANGSPRTFDPVINITGIDLADMPKLRSVLDGWGASMINLLATELEPMRIS